MRLGKLALVLAAGLMLASTATAQPGRGGGRGGFGGGGLAMMIGNSEQLQKELKVDKDQVEKLTAALTKARESMSSEFEKLRNPDTSREDRDAILKKMSEANNKAVESVLKSDQVKRLHQIENQQAGFAMYQKEDVQKALKLTDEQKDKIKEIGDDLRKEEQALGGGRGGRGGPGGFGGFDPETQQKRQALRKDAQKAAEKVLTADQKTTLKDLTGEPFELQFTPGGFGGGGGFGGFGGGFANRGNPGQVLSPGAQGTLKLTDEQKKKLEDLQKEVDSQLKKILTEDQQKQLKDLQQQPGFGGGFPGGRGPGGRGPGGGKPNPDF